MAIRKYRKGSNQFVQPNFQASEFDCRCKSFKCQETLIDDDLAFCLQLMHDKLMLPLHITEGYRCAIRQQELRDAKKPDGSPKYLTAAGRSPHEDGLAADVRTGKHSGADLEAVARKAGFRAVGVGKKFVHVDTRDIMTRTHKPRRWVYPY